MVASRELSRSFQGFPDGEVKRCLSDYKCNFF